MHSLVLGIPKKIIQRYSRISTCRHEPELARMSDQTAQSLLDAYQGMR